MTKQQTGLLATSSQPLIGVLDADLHQVRYFTTEEEADAALAADAVTDALSLAGVWRDLEWEAVVSDLDRLRHESKPTPPLAL